MFWTVGLVTLLTGAGLTYLSTQWIQRRQETEILSLSERSAVALDMQFTVWKTAVAGLASSHPLVREFDTQSLRWDAMRVANNVGGWVALIPLDDLSLHVFNTLRNSAAPIRTSGPAPELEEVIARSRASGKAEVSNVFRGRVAHTEIFTVVQIARASTGDDYAVVLAVDARVLSKDLEKAALDKQEFISVTDGSERIIARSSQIDQFFLQPVPGWFVDRAKAALPAPDVVATGPGLPGSGKFDFLFARHRLQAAPFWSVTVAKPKPALAFSSYVIIAPLLGSFLVFGLALAFGSARLSARRREENLQAAQERSEREQHLRMDLQKALDKAQIAETARRNMLGVLGHEMRTPVLSALAAIQMFPQELKAKDERNYLVLAEKGLKVLQSLIDDVLDLARLRSGELRIDTAPFNLTELLDDAADIMGPMAERHRLDFKLDWPGEPVSVIGDRARIRQILINLLTNAFRYTRKGHVALSGTWECGQNGTCQVRICVTDTGPGIPADRIDDIFKPYFRVENGMGDRVKGLGLGLSITERLAQAMGGAIEVRSEVGQGSTFCLVIDLPVAPVASQPAQGESQETDVSLVGKSVLLVEDSILQAQLVSALLTQLGARTDVTDMGRDAVEAVARCRYDIILIDLGLPDMTGVDLVRKLHDAGSTAIHIALSANPASLSTVEKALFDAVATKTTSKKDLHALLASALQGRAAG